MNINELKKSHGDSMNAVEQAERQIEQSAILWKQRIASGADDIELDALELDQMRLQRNIERLRCKEQIAHAAVTNAESVEAGKLKKKAADAFLREHHSMAALLDQVEQAAQAFIAATATLEDSQPKYFEAAMTAQQVGSKPTVTALRLPTNLIAQTKSACGVPAMLNARFN